MRNQIIGHKWFVVDVTFRYAHKTTVFEDDVDKTLDEWKDAIQFFLTESSSCAGNIIDDLTYADDAQKCACWNIQKAEVIREATQDDMEYFDPKTLFDPED